MGFLDRLFSRRSYDTMFGRANIIVMPNSNARNVRILEIDGAFQSATFEDEHWTEPAFAYYQGFDAIFQAECTGKPMDHVLMLGAGGFAWPKHILTKRQDVTVDVVEIDPQIITIARKHFYLDALERLLEEEERMDSLRIIVDDAYRFLETTSCTYDAIINDVFQGDDAPESTSSLQFLRSARAHLTPGGIYAQNVVVDLTKEGAYQLFKLMTNASETFQHVCAIEASDAEYGGADNYIILASDADYPFKGKIDYLAS